MIDEIDKQKNRDIELFQKFYDFATKIIYQKIATNTNMKEKLHDFRLEINGVTNTMKFTFDNQKKILIPQCDNDVVTMASGQDITFAFIRDIALMFKKNNDEKMNIYVLNEELIPETQQGIKSDTWNIKNVPIENAKKFLSSFVDNPEPSDENNFAKQVKNELDFKCVFSEITENDNKQDIERIVAQNQERIDVMRKFKEQFNKKPKLQMNMSFSGFEIKGFKNNEKINLRYNSKGETYMLDKNYDKKASNLDNEDYYFGQYDLLMACTKSNNGKVNVFATNATVEQNPYDDKNNNHDIFAVYNVTQVEAETFIENLNKYPMNKDNYNITEQEQFEKFFQDHCKQDIKIEKDDGKSNVCCWGLFNCCDASKAK